MTANKINMVIKPCISNTSLDYQHLCDLCQVSRQQLEQGNIITNVSQAERKNSPIKWWIRVNTKILIKSGVLSVITQFESDS